MNSTYQSSPPPPPSIMQEKEHVEVKPDEDPELSTNEVEVIKPEHPITIDTVFRRISLYLNSTDLMACFQISWNCYWIAKEIFETTEHLIIPTLNELNSSLAAVDYHNRVGHLSLQHFGYFQTYTNPQIHDTEEPEVLIKHLAEHKKLNYLTKVTFINPASIYFYRNLFNYFMKTIGHRLQELCINDNTTRNFWGPYIGNPRPQRELFPIHRGANEIEKTNILEFKNMQRLEVQSHSTACEISVTGLALTFPNLVELYLKGIFGIYNTEDESYFIQLPVNQTKVIRKLPQLINLRQLSIHYEPIQRSRAKGQLTILTAMQLQLKYLELVNVSYYTYPELIMAFLETQRKTLETLKLLSTIGTTYSLYQAKLLRFFLPNIFLQLKEIHLAKLFINDNFTQTLEAIPNATKISFKLMRREIWGNIPEQTKLS